MSVNGEQHVRRRGEQLAGGEAIAGVDGSEEEVEVDVEPSVPQGNLWGGFMNLLTGAIGVGILSFPFAFKSAGVVGITVLGLFFALLNAYTLSLLARYARLHSSYLAPHPTYEALVGRVLGKRAYVVAVTCILVNTVGALSAFLIVVGDLGHTVLKEWLHGSDVPEFFYSKACVVLVFCFCVALPLSLFPNIHDLSFSSLLAVASVLVVAGMVIARGIEACVDGRMVNGRQQGEALVLVNLEPEFLMAVPLVVFSLGCHLQVVPVYHSLKREKKPWMTSILVGSVSTCIVVYLVTGVMGYLRFGDDSEGDVLSNFPVSDIVLDVGKLLMAAHISLAYPVALYPCTKSVQLLLTFLPFDYFKPRIDQKQARWRSFVSHWSITLCMLGITAGLAIFIPKIQIVSGLVGSTSAVMINFFLPGLMLLMSPLSLPYDTNDPALNGVRMVTNHGFRSATEEDDALSPVHVTASSPLLLLEPPVVTSKPSRNIFATAAGERVIALCIIALSILIGICGTGVNIYQNFFLG